MQYLKAEYGSFARCTDVPQAFTTLEVVTSLHCSHLHPPYLNDDAARSASVSNIERPHASLRVGFHGLTRSIARDSTRTHNKQDVVLGFSRGKPSDGWICQVCLYSDPPSHADLP